MLLERWLTKRSEYYGLFTLVFLGIYGSIILFFNGFPTHLLLAILAVQLLKDVFDQLRIKDGGKALAYHDIEHNPSNIVILAFLLLGIVEPEGATLGFSNTVIGYLLASVDLLIDGYQDWKQG